MNYTTKFLEFEGFWKSNIERKLFRCAKDLGFLDRLKKELTGNSKMTSRDKFIKIYNILRKDLNSHDNLVIDYVNDKRRMKPGLKFTASTALNDKRHFSQLVAFSILDKIFTSSYSLIEYDFSISSELYSKATIMMTDEIYHGHKISSYIKEQFYLFKLFFKN